MEIIPVAFATIFVPIGAILAIRAVDSTEPNQALLWAAMSLIILGIVAMFWANWLVYQKRKEDIRKDAEERLMRIEQMQVLEEMLSELKKLRGE